MAVENRGSLYWNCANSLKPETHAHKLLKSYYMNMCRKYVKSIQLPKEKFAPTTMCSYCGSFWNEAEFKLRLKPQQLALKGKTKKLIERLNKSKEEAGQKEVLSGKQRKRAKWLQKRARQSMEIKCEQCNHKSLIKMEKPKTRRQKIGIEKDVTIEEEVVVVENESNIKSKKKKKNKNKSAGLKLPQLESNPEKQNANSLSLPVKSIKCPSAISKTNPPQQRNKAKKKKTSTNAAATTASNTNKMRSKTQQQNSLLHLAALLKHQSSSATSNGGKSSAQKRLESLLK